MPALYPDLPLNCGIELRGIHRTPARKFHYAPTRRCPSPTVVVGASHYRKVQRVGKRDDACTHSLNHTDTLRCSVAQLDCVKPGESVQLVVGKLGEVAGNCENQQRH